MSSRATHPGHVTTQQAQPLPWRLDCHVAAGDDAAAADELRRALTDRRPWMPARWFYDDAGCELFVRITDLDEYYQTRTEQALLDAHIDELVREQGTTELVEIGSGAARKTRAILDGMEAAGTLRRFIPFDISPGAVAASATDIAAAYPGTRVQGVAGDFSRHLSRIPRRPADGRRMVAFLGGTIGNLEPPKRRTMMRRLARLVRPGDCLLMGTDLAHDPEVLVRAYDDAQGVTAEFNRNIIRHINHAYAGDADPADFAHVARWNARASRIEMHLRARRDIAWNIAGLGIVVPIEAGATIRTEISCKFTPDSVRAMYEDAGLALAAWHEDPQGRYALSVATPG
ncbi:MAG: L-histidine N(alpha)-methyltransferase [Actinomycetota bacterium]